MEFTTIDIILFGGTALFLLVMVLLVKENEKGSKIKNRLNRYKEKSVDEKIEEKVLSLRRESDHSLDAYGLQRLSYHVSLRLKAAGMDMCARSYALGCLSLFLVFFLLVAVLLQHSLLLGLLVGFVIGFGVPHFYVGMQIRKRQRQFLKLFPDAIELIVRGLRAGLPVAESMQTVAEEISEPVSSVFRDICDQIKLGVPMEKAMAEKAESLQMTEFNFFVISVTLQRETGGNLGEILDNLAEVLRQRHVMKLKIKAMSSEARASAYIVGSLPFLVVLALLVISPDYMLPLAEDYRGNIAALGAVCSLGMGIFIMSRLAKFKI